MFDNECVPYFTVVNKKEDVVTGFVVAEKPLQNAALFSREHIVLVFSYIQCMHIHMQP